MSKLRLITIPVSHFCEKARWALDRISADYVEEGHAPLLHYAPTFARGRSRTVPVLVTPHGNLRDSTDILKHLDAWVEEKHRLFPHDPAQLSEVERLEAAFDHELGPRVRRWAYAWIIDDVRSFDRIIGQNLSPAERVVFRALRPILIAALARALRLRSPGLKERAFGRIHETVAQLGLEERLAGHRYLVGDRFSAADLTLATLGALLVFPENYGGRSGVRLPSLDELPAGLRSQIESFRQTNVGSFILRLYREERLTSAV